VQQHCDAVLLGGVGEGFAACLLNFAKDSGTAFAPDFFVVVLFLFEPFAVAFGLTVAKLEG
jgi:hypothetical protein